MTCVSLCVGVNVCRFAFEILCMSKYAGVFFIKGDEYMKPCYYYMLRGFAFEAGISSYGKTDLLTTLDFKAIRIASFKQTEFLILILRNRFIRLKSFYKVICKSYHLYVCNKFTRP